MSTLRHPICIWRDFAILLDPRAEAAPRETGARVRDGVVALA